MPVYLELFNGRHSPDEELDDWGFEGPVLGPFPFVHITYGSDIKTGEDITTKDSFIFRQSLANLSIDKNGDVKFAGSYYGDFSTFSTSTIHHQLGEPLKQPLRHRIKVTQEVFKTDPALLIGYNEEWVKQYITWRFKNDTTQPHPNLRETPDSPPGKPRPTHRQAHAKPGRGRGKNL